MYNYLKGIVTDTNHDLTIECNGVGYLVVPTYGLCANSNVGEMTTVFVHHDVKETSQTLYGFASVGERELFRKLIGVNGVGPKGALALLSVGEEKLITAILNQDVSGLSRIKGIGTKVVEKVILDLRGKLTKTKDSSLDFLQPTQNSATLDAIMGLMNLGLAKSVATERVARIKSDGLSAEQIIMEALKNG